MVQEKCTTSCFIFYLYDIRLW